jgi:uncharacterized RDD family membrane protein YckC
MRCPKCQYITFDSGDRCRNCGYEFSLSPGEEPIDVRIARDEPESARRGSDSFNALDAPLSANAADRAGHAGGGRRPVSAADLPLFTDRVADDQAPLVSPPAVPRAPLSVRKAAPARPRPRGPAPDELPLGLPAPRSSRPAAAGDADNESAGDGILAAAAGRRIGAGLIDVTVLGAIAAAVVVLTLRITGLPVSEWGMLPVAPMLSFLLLLCGGYFVLFTAAGGQTIGKMTTGIRVVNAPESMPARVAFSTAAVRTIVCLGSVLALGAGFLPILFSADRRAFHDRVADTRVVNA